mmetsp:Transcript_2004/g.5941  ORF Transcript_2004/g.5941 Transcript_2004/m.5941 type:complete len:205 (+) Transcript_2004:177-791(+)
MVWAACSRAARGGSQPYSERYQAAKWSRLEGSSSRDVTSSVPSASVKVPERSNWRRPGRSGLCVGGSTATTRRPERTSGSAALRAPSKERQDTPASGNSRRLGALGASLAKNVARWAFEKTRFVGLSRMRKFRERVSPMANASSLFALVTAKVAALPLSLAARQWRRPVTLCSSFSRLRCATTLRPRGWYSSRATESSFANGAF